jgi:dynein heavy chain
LERFARDLTHILLPGLEKAIGVLDSDVQEKKYITAGLELDVAIKELGECDEKCKKLEADAKRFNSYEFTLNMPPSRF